MNTIIKNYYDQAKLSGKTPFFDYETAIKILKQYKDKKVNILGIDAVSISKEYTQPYMEHSIDFSNVIAFETENVWDAAISFLNSKKSLGLFYEIILEN